MEKQTTLGSCKMLTVLHHHTLSTAKNQMFDGLLYLYLYNILFYVIISLLTSSCIIYFLFILFDS